MPRCRGSCRRPPSPSTRRAWIEIPLQPYKLYGCTSPSTRRAWIEISKLHNFFSRRTSPSTRRAWIEIGYGKTSNSHTISRPPHGGRGLKSHDRLQELRGPRSPSTRRAWIEMTLTLTRRSRRRSRPPHGGRGLKFGSGQIAIPIKRRPPHGGRGLKSVSLGVFKPN